MVQVETRLRAMCKAVLEELEERIMERMVDVQGDMYVPDRMMAVGCKC